MSQTVLDTLVLELGYYGIAGLSRIDGLAFSLSTDFSDFHKLENGI
jgi:hypothetical protein